MGPVTALALFLALQLTAQSAPIADASGGSTIKVVKKKAPPDEDTQPRSAPPRPRSAPLTAAAIEGEPLAPNAAAPIGGRVSPVDLGLRAAPAPAPTITLEGTPPKEPRILPWITLGGSAVAAVVGAVFAVKTVDAVDALGELDAKVSGTKVTLPDEFKDQQKAVFTNGLAATLLLSSAVAGAIASSVILASD